MNPLGSSWFFRLVEEEAQAPAERLLAVFRITEKWISAPGIRESLNTYMAGQPHPLQDNGALRGFIGGLAHAAGAQKPDILTHHLLILLQGAILEELRSPELHALAEARNAAAAVIAQSRPQLRRRSLATASLAGVAATLLVGFVVWQFAASPAPSQNTPLRIAQAPQLSMPAGVNPSDMEAVLTLHEQFERGICPAPHLLALPPGQMIAYTNAINFRTPENPAADRENLRAFMTWFNKTQSTECYFAPKNGHTTTTWTKG